MFSKTVWTGGNAKVELDLSNCATKVDLKGVAAESDFVEDVDKKNL